ncbi:MAG: T9SS type A sorting domain-containing protein, partial [Saprospiraceae bacterium]|nr:T9SS type A sorting domain-containing protein [Saprospiraceae bacterium]
GGPCSSVPPTPALKYVQGIVSGQAYLVWTHLPMDEPYWNGFYYTIRIRATGTEHWTEFQAISYDPEYYDFPSTFIEGDTYGFRVRGLPRNTDLEWQVRARFSDLEPSEWSEICQFNSSDPAGYSNCSLPCNAPNALYANFSPTGETFTTGLGWANLDNDPFSYLVEIREAGTTDWDNNIVSQLITNPTFWPSPGFYYAEVELQIQKIYEWRVSIKCSEEGEWIPSEVADLSTNPYSIKKPGSGIVNNNKPLGIANLAELEVFPNPASNLLNVNIPLLGSSDGLLSLLDYTGRTVIAQPINAKEMSVEWDVSSLPKGLYMVQLRNQGNIKVKRIIIQ